MNPRDSSSVYFSLELKNEGTSPISVQLSVSPVNVISDNGVLQPPTDEWWKLLNESGPWDLSPMGTEGDSVIVELNLTAHPESTPSSYRETFSRCRDFRYDLNLFDINAPTVNNVIRLEAEVERIEGLVAVLAGEGGAEAEPGQWASFSLAVGNDGNGPTQYEVSCSTENSWPINIWESESPVILTDPIGRLLYTTLPIKIKIPKLPNGEPSAGAIEAVTCVTQSVNDPSLVKFDSVTVRVLANDDFHTDITLDDGTPLGPLALAEDRGTQRRNDFHILDVSNDGNIPMIFEVEAFSSLNTWPIQIVYGDEQTLDSFIVEIPAGSLQFSNQHNGSMAAQIGDSNTITIRTTHSNGE